jgi:hypothetical protein
MQGFLKPKLILPRLSVVLLASALAICLCSSLSSPSYAASNSGNVRGPVGSWLIKATPTSGPSSPSFHELYSYIPGNIVVETDETDFTTQSLASPAHGTWKSIGKGRFASTTLNFFFDAQGNPAGRVEVRETDTLSKNGNIYTGSASFTSFDLQGKQVDFGTFTTRATRITVKLP